MENLTVKQLERNLGTINGDPEWFARQRAKDLVIIERLLHITDTKYKPVSL